MGKSSLVHRYIDGGFQSTRISTIEFDFRVKRLEYEKRRVRVHIWDTAGQERFNSVCYKFCRGANGIMLVYNITQRDSFYNVRDWLDIIRKHCHKDIKILLIGNQCDLEEDRVVSREEGEKLAADLELHSFTETSAKDNRGVRDAFSELIHTVITDGPNPILTKSYRDEDEAVKKIFCTCCS